MDDIARYLESMNLRETAEALRKEQVHSKSKPPAADSQLSQILAQELPLKSQQNKENNKIMQNFMAKLLNKQKAVEEEKQSEGLLEDPALQNLIKRATNVAKKPSKPAQKPQKEKEPAPIAKKVEERREARKIERVLDPAKMPSMIAGEGNSTFMDASSFTFPNDNPTNESPDEYIDEDDPGFDLYEVHEEFFENSCKELATRFGFPARSIKPEPNYVEPKRSEDHDVSKDDVDISTESRRSKRPPKETNQEDESGAQGHKEKLKIPNRRDLLKDERKGLTKTASEGELRKSSSAANLDEIIKKVEPGHSNLLPKRLKFPYSDDSYYPVECEGIIYDCFNLKVIFDRERTGFEETKDFPIVIGSVIAGRYVVQAYLGSAAFSKAIQCYDMHKKISVCMKVIENNKDYFDQSVDEIKLLRYIDLNGDVEKRNVLKFYDFFYHKEHLFIITELLKENLYEYSKNNRENDNFTYFTIGRLQKVTMQVLNALSYIHSLHLVHCDLKPENILLKSYSKAEVKVIDFGSTCFIHDHLSSYVQSRSYRAPEVILGCSYDYKIDIWSLGCILAEMLTGYVLFQNDTIQGLMARVVGIIGPVPEHMMKKGKLVGNYFTKEGLIYQDPQEENENKGDPQAPSEPQTRKRRRVPGENMKVQILIPKATTLKHRLKTDDEAFIDFVRWLLEIDPDKRPTAKEAMKHRWLTECKYSDGLSN